MKLKLDENLSKLLKAVCSSRGHDACTVEDEGLISQPDTVIGRVAAAEGRMLMTLDVAFADLRSYPPGSHPGIILFRPRSFGPLSVNRFVEQFLLAHDLTKFAGCTVVVEPGSLRVRSAQKGPATDL